MHKSDAATTNNFLQFEIILYVHLISPTTILATDV